MQKKVRNRFNIGSYPMSIIVVWNGEIRRVNLGFEEGDGEKLTTAIREALTEVSEE